MKKILLVGEPMLLFMADSYGNLEDVKNFTTSVAGAELNVAIGLTRLGYNCEYMTKLGEDPFGKRIKKFIEKENIGSKYISFDLNNRTGIQVKSSVKNGDPDICYFRKNSAASKITKEDIDRINFDDILLIHITGIPLAISKSFREAIYHLIDKARKKNIYISFDPNLRLQMWESIDELKKVINDISTKVDIIFPGIGECEILFGTRDIEKIKEEYFKLGIKKIVLKNGDVGSYYFEKGLNIFKESFKVKEIVDTVGAGDGFAVGIISGIIDGLDFEKMLERANAIGAIQLSHRSDNEGLPNKKELGEYILRWKNEK